MVTFSKNKSEVFTVCCLPLISSLKLDDLKWRQDGEFVDGKLFCDVKLLL